MVKLKQIDNIDENFDLFKTIYELYQIDNPVVEPIYKQYPIKVKL